MKKGHVKFKQDALGLEVYHAFNKKGEHLGGVIYDVNWKEYIWMQENDIGMSIDCLQEVVDFIRQKNNHRLKKQNR